ncbi:hypothetical protein Q1695_003651 [Nippostrongylus brasiliensis]|nr:hypothetical protein Q1695_003651 [Nippostrongylus brasiliensis]
MDIRDTSNHRSLWQVPTPANFDEEERCFVRYEVQLKYNEGRYSAIYIVSKQICKDNVMKDACGLFALKTGLRNGSSTFGVKIKREIRILSEMSKAKQSWAPHYFQCGSVCDMPFIIMALVDMNVEKLRELLGGKFKPASGFYIAGEILNALTDLHSRGFVHRDVKPTNICVGVGTQASRIFLIDYGDTIRIGKKIKYSVADAYTLPYWSLDAHEKKPATEKTDIEAWFYTTLDLIPPDVITWKTELNEREVQKAKKNFWTDIQNNMPHCSPSLISVAETISTAENKIDVTKLKLTLKSGFQQAVGTGKKYVPEWEKTINTAITTTPAATKTKITPKEAGTAVRTAT